MHGQRAKLQGDGIDLRVDQHGRIVHERVRPHGKAKRLQLPQDRILAYVNLVLQPMNQVGPSPALMESALKLRGEHGFSFYDSLTIARATHPGRLCNRRLHHGATGRAH